MKLYDLDTLFTFGKHQGKTVREVVDQHPSYLNWCIIHLDHFYISDDSIPELTNLGESFSEEALMKLSEKKSLWEAQNHTRYNRSDDSESSRSYDEYGGAYDFDDDTINTAFDGDPEAYWNID